MVEEEEQFVEAATEGGFFGKDFTAIDIPLVIEFTGGCCCCCCWWWWSCRDVVPRSLSLSVVDEAVDWADEDIESRVCGSIRGHRSHSTARYYCIQY